MKNNLYYRTKQELFLRLSKLFFIISFIIILVDTYESYKHHFYAMVFMEVTVLLLHTVTFLLYYFKMITLQTLSATMVISVSLLIVMSFFIIGQNPEFALFALAIMPSFIFFFLGPDMGKRFTVFMVFMLFLAVLDSHYKIIEPIIFSPSLTFQILIGYIGISFLHYRFEQYRFSFENQLINFSKNQKTLLKELNHRVKNNLQMIMGLLLMQSKRVSSNECKKVLNNQVNRLKAIGLVHEQLSSDKGPIMVEMDEYLENIINSLQLLTNHKIILESEKLTLDTATATYIGLFVNEAVSNAIEHAYLPNTSEEIKVSFRFEDDSYQLIVEDFGQGFSGSDVNNSLGLLLMENISDFLEESFMIMDFDEGTKITLEFGEPKKEDKLLNSELL